MDVTVICSLQPSWAGHALSVGEHRNMSAACRAVGVPLGFEALGGMSEATTTSRPAKLGRTIPHLSVCRGLPRVTCKLPWSQV